MQSLGYKEKSYIVQRYFSQKKVSYFSLASCMVTDKKYASNCRFILFRQSDQTQLEISYNLLSCPFLNRLDATSQMTYRKTTNINLSVSLNFTELLSNLIVLMGISNANGRKDQGCQLSEVLTNFKVDIKRMGFIICSIFTHVCQYVLF